MPNVAPAQRADSRFCHLCGQLLASRYYTYDTGLVCCSACHAARPRCARCNLPLDDRAIARAGALPAGEPGSAQSVTRSRAESGPVLCISCQRSTPRCTSCHRHIVGTWYTFDGAAASARRPPLLRPVRQEPPPLRPLPRPYLCWHGST